MTASRVLALLIAPLEEDTLRARIAQRVVFAITGTAPGLAQTLLPWPAIEMLKTSQAVPAQDYYLGFRGGAVPRAAYRTPNGALRPQIVQGFIDKGATLVFDDVGPHVPAIGDLGAQIAVLLGASVRANAYLTYGDISVFGAHEDAHDVLALQVHGAKLWRFPGTAGDVILQPGDALFLPRGVIHEALPQELPSVHVSFGIVPPSNPAENR